MTGINSEAYGDPTQYLIYSQEFVPFHSHISDLLIDVSKKGIDDNGFLHWTISNKKGELCAGGDLSYTLLENGRFTTLDEDIFLKPFHTYYLNIAFDSTNGQFPRLIVNHGDEMYPETKTLFCNDVALEDTYMVWALTYSDAVPLLSAIFIIFLPLLTLAAFFWAKNLTIKFQWITAVISILCLPCIALYICEQIIDGPKYWINFHTLISNLKLFYLFLIALFIITLSVRATLRIGIASLIILYTIDYYFLQFRGVPFKFTSLSGADTAMDVIGKYHFSPNFAILLSVLLLLFIWQLPLPCLYSLHSLKAKIKLHIFSFILGILYISGMWHYMMNSSYLDHMNGTQYKSGFHNVKGYQISGFLAATMLELKNGRLSMPEGYSETLVQSAMAPYEDKVLSTPDDKPHIIVIVNESLADLSVLGDLNLTEDPLSYMNSITSNAIRGYVNMSTLGGGTANSEFEFFTGYSNAFLPQEYYPFSSLIHGETEGIVSHLNDLGYETYSIHPESATNWNRSVVYPYLGFSHSYWDTDFADAPRLHHGVTDLATYEKIIDIYESNHTQFPLFIYDMTMQNHGGYTKIDVENVIPYDDLSASEFFSISKYTDNDFEKLIDYFSSQNEKVVICIFGDHQPKLNDSFYDKIFSSNGKDDFTNHINLYKTPFVIWANYDIDEQTDLDISINYLSGMLLDASNLPKTDFMYYLSDLQREYPIITQNFISDSDGNIYSMDSLPDNLKTYQYIQYYRLNQK